MWLHRNQAKIDALEKEIREIKENEHTSVFAVLKGRSEQEKDEVYKALLRISLMSDACNEACEVAKDLLAKYGVTDFSFRAKVDDLCKRSSEIAAIVLVPNSKVLEDFMVDNAKFVDICMKHADAHLKRKLKL